jgi:hypothetical protein
VICVQPTMVGMATGIGFMKYCFHFGLFYLSKLHTTVVYTTI